MKVSIAASVLFLALWTTWGIRNWRRPEAKLAVVFCLLMTGAGSLEIFDFVPMWDLVDAHALWHVSTAPLTLLYYAFLTADARRHALSLDKGIIHL